MIWTSEMDFGLQLCEAGAPLQNSASEKAEPLPSNPGIRSEGPLSRRGGMSAFLNVAQPPVVEAKSRASAGGSWGLPSSFWPLLVGWRLHRALRARGPPPPWHLGQTFLLGEASPEDQRLLPAARAHQALRSQDRVSLRGKHTMLPSAQQKLGSWLPRAGLGGGGGVRGTRADG